MVKVELDKVFRKHYKSRISRNKNLVRKYEQRFEIFLRDRRNLLLKDHKLTGKLRDKRAFSITGDIRVVYMEESKDNFVFLDIGTHPQIYGM